MATPSKSKANLSERVASLEVEFKHLAKAQEVEGFLKRNGYWIWPVATILLGSGIFWFSLSAAIDKQIMSKLEEPLKQMAQMRVDDANLKGQLQTLIDLNRQKLKADASLSPEQLRYVLPEATLELKNAAILKTAPPSNFDELQASLRAADRNANGFWPAAAALVNYESTIRSPLKPSDIDGCFTFKHTEHAFKGNLLSPGQLGGWRPRYYDFDDCEVDLSDLNALNKALFIGLHDPSRESEPIIFRFNHALVKYKGGPMIQVGEMDFFDCAFQIQPDTIPSNPSKRLMESLLAMDLSSISFKPQS